MGDGNSLMTDVGLLGVRLVVGGLMAGHGAQKLFGKFGGHGLQGTAGFLESIGMKPGSRWAMLAGASEFGGGVLTATGLMSPVGPITIMAPMTMAARTVHADKPIWVSEGGPELAVINMAAVAGLTLAGPGRFSLDAILGIKLPFFMVALVAAATAAGVYIGLTSREQSLTEQRTESPEASTGTPPQSDDSGSSAAHPPSTSANGASGGTVPSKA